MNMEILLCNIAIFERNTDETLYEEKQKELSTTNNTLNKLKGQYDKVCYLRG
jgi:hypothetical protein